jgi:hypothetical protein
MARLGHKELQTLSAALLELYSPYPHADLPARMFATMRSCIAFEFLWERTKLNLLKPHFLHAFTISQLFSYFEDATSASSHAYIIADGTGRILF